jgi:DNA (cytosine-5)-methyltransferase 1
VSFKPGQSEAAGGTFATDEFAPTLQAQNNGSTAVPAVAFKPSHFTRGKDGRPDEVTPPLSADADKGDQDTVVCATGQRTHALTTRAACEEDGTGRGNPIVPMHAQAMRESGQGFWMKDEIAGTLRAEGERRPSRPSNVFAQPTNAVGFNWQNGGGYGNANDGLGITEEGTGPLQRCNTPAVSFNAYQRTEGDATWPIGASDGRKVEVGVRSGMQVRRLTPNECEFLQGFPSGHTDIIFRKKPAADGPRYRALGNSMAVPCMVWLGHRIQQATKGDNL